MPITVCMWSDRVVYTITEVKSPTRFVVEGCKAVTLRKNGQWRFKGETMRGGAVTLRKNGQWRFKGETMVEARELWEWQTSTETPVSRRNPLRRG